MEAMITGIKARVTDPSRAVEAATWVIPMPAIRPPARPDEVDAAEAALGFPIPLLLRRLYTEVGNGGFGPGYGLEGVPTIPPTSGEADIVALYEQYSGPSAEYPAVRWPRGWCRSSVAAACTWNASTSYDPRTPSPCSTAMTATRLVRLSSP